MAEEKILIPLLWKTENDEEFLDAATEKAKEVFLLLVVDAAAVGGSFGFATAEISQGNAMIDAMKDRLQKKGKSVTDAMEWGNIKTKIEHFAQLKQVDKVVIKRHTAQFMDDLSEHLKKAKIKVEII